MFHYNKAHNTDQTIPCWIVKHKGTTYYVDHLDSEVGFTTKETPGNDHTKGALQFKGLLNIIEDTDGKTTAKIRAKGKLQLIQPAIKCSGRSDVTCHYKGKIILLHDGLALIEF